MLLKVRLPVDSLIPVKGWLMFELICKKASWKEKTSWGFFFSLCEEAGSKIWKLWRLLESFSCNFSCTDNVTGITWCVPEVWLWISFWHSDSFHTIIIKRNSRVSDEWLLLWCHLYQLSFLFLVLLHGLTVKKVTLDLVCSCSLGSHLHSLNNVYVTWHLSGF